MASFTLLNGQIFNLYVYFVHYRFPFFAADVLASNAMILQALLEGGWSQEKEDSEPEEVQRDDPDFEPSENALV